MEQIARTPQQIGAAVRRVRRLLAQRARARGADVFSLLAAVGRDCVGAMQFLPPGMEPGPVGVLQTEPTSQEGIVELVANLAGRPLGVSEEGELRLSLAGAQEKTAL